MKQIRNKRQDLIVYTILFSLYMFATEELFLLLYVLSRVLLSLKLKPRLEGIQSVI